MKGFEREKMEPCLHSDVWCKKFIAMHSKREKWEPASEPDSREVFPHQPLFCIYFKIGAFIYSMFC